MKVCQYCNSECDDGEKACHSCGASEFSNKCRNCGTVFDSGFCPNCGVKVGQKPRVCPKCGNEYYTNACPNCGYNGLVQNAPPTANTFQPAYVTNSNRNRKSKTSIGTILLWIFFLPIMAIVAIWKSEKLDKKWKIILTVIILAFYLVAGAVNSNTSSTSAFIAGILF
ncbi:MAG TPA: hypothetical protein DCY31_07495 [Ruminococcaceae bacterium]|nr:hypothetical protein [Oscillospiraceae bacterium]